MCACALLHQKKAFFFSSKPNTSFFFLFFSIVLFVELNVHAILHNIMKTKKHFLVSLAPIVKRALISCSWVARVGRSRVGEACVLPKPGRARGHFCWSLTILVEIGLTRWDGEQVPGAP